MFRSVRVWGIQAVVELRVREVCTLRMEVRQPERTDGA